MADPIRTRHVLGRYAVGVFLIVGATYRQLTLGIRIRNVQALAAEPLYDREGIEGSSDLSMVWVSSVGTPAVGSKHDPQPVMIKVSESVGEPTGFLDDQIDGFGAAVGDP